MAHWFVVYSVGGLFIISGLVGFREVRVVIICGWVIVSFFYYDVTDGVM